MDNNREKADRYLHSVQKLKSKIKRLQGISCDLQDMLDSCTVDPGAEKVDVSKDGDKFGTLMAKKIDLDNEISETIAEYISTSQDLQEMFAILETPHYADVLTDRYIRGMSWSEMAEDLNLTPRWCAILHDRAVADFRDMIDTAA